MNKDTALRLALEALEVANSLVDGYYLPKEKAWLPEIEEAITAIKAVLKANDEPVVWNEGVPAMLPKQKEGETFIVSYEPKLEAKDEPVQEPWESEMRNELVALGFDGQCPESIGITLKRWRDGYAVAQRTWVGLTDKEIDVIYEQHHNQYGECESVNWGYERAIEAKLKEKNT